MYFKLIDDFEDCLGNNTNYTQNIFHSPKSTMYWAYIELKLSLCEENIDVEYGDYCINDYEYEPLPEKRECIDDSCSFPNGYTSNNVPDSSCLWHLNYIDGDTSDKKYNHLHSDTSYTDIYILDWGTRTSHEEFSPNRCEQIGSSDNIDYHGTHCASIAGGNTAGLAKSSPIYTLAFADGQSIDMAIEATISHMESRNSQFSYQRRSVVSMSWGWSFSSSEFIKFNDYFDEMADLGGVMFAATTNSYTNHGAPCDGNNKDGPGGCNSVITVSNYKSDWNLNWSGYGDCVDVAGPGTTITAASDSCDTCYRELTGTSMATPAVAGFVANMLNYDRTLTVEQIRSIITGMSFVCVCVCINNPSAHPKKLVCQAD